MLTTLLLLGLAAEPGVAPSTDDPEIVVTASLAPAPRSLV